MRSGCGRFQRTSREIAKARTRLTIAADHFGCCPEELEQMRREITDVLRKYMDLDEDMLKIRLDIGCGTGRGVQDVKTIQIK